MPKVEIRYQRISDAKRFVEIINNPKFKFFGSNPTLKEEINFLQKNKERRRKKLEYNFTILYDKIVVGGVGMKIDQPRTFIGEIGYFVDYNYWGKGIATQAVKLLEKWGFNKLKLERIEIIMNPKNKASEMIAIKCGYKKEGLMKKALHDGSENAYLYAKVKD